MIILYCYVVTLFDSTAMCVQDYISMLNPSLNSLQHVHLNEIIHGVIRKPIYTNVQALTTSQG